MLFISNLIISLIFDDDSSEQVRMFKVTLMIWLWIIVLPITIYVN